MRIILLLWLTYFSVSSSDAQTTTAHDALRANEQSIRHSQQPQLPEVDVFIPEMAQPAVKQSTEATDLGECVPIAAYELDEEEGGDIQRPPSLLFEPYIGACVSAKQLNDLLGDLNTWYQSRGWITTRAYIDAEQIKSQRLKIKVVRGRIEKIAINGNPLDPRITTAFHERKTGLLNLRDLEQGLENINRLPSQKGTFKLHPGQGAGGSNVEVEIKQNRRFRLGETIDNSGSKALGRWKSTTELAWDNPLRLNDQLAIGLLRNLDKGDLNALFQGLTFNYLTPKAYHLWHTSASWIDTRFTLPGVNSNYKLQTQAKKVGVGYEYLYDRDQQNKHSFLAGLDISRQKTEIQDIEIKSQTRKLSVAYVGLKGKHYRGNYVYDWSLRIEQGLKFANAQTSLSDGTAPQYQTTKIKLSSILPMPKDIGLIRSSLTAQIAKHNVPTLAQLQVGGRYDVRGFQQNSLLSPSGWHLRNEYETPSWQSGSVQANAFAGLDAGRVRSTPNRPTSQQHLIGSALGLRVGFKNTKAELAYARAISRPTEFSNESKNHWYAQASLSF